MGKTHLAVALGVEAVAHGANVYLITIPDLLDQLARDVQENRLSDHPRSLRHPTLLIIDEMGYLPLDQVATSFLFQLVSKRPHQGQHHRHLEQVLRRMGLRLRRRGRRRGRD